MAKGLINLVAIGLWLLRLVKKNLAHPFFTVPTEEKENSIETMFKRMKESGFVKPKLLQKKTKKQKQKHFGKFNLKGRVMLI